MTVLSNCFQDDNNKETDYNCTGIDFLTYKVNDSEKFCKEASSKTLIDIKGKKKVVITKDVVQQKINDVSKMVITLDDEPAKIEA